MGASWAVLERREAEDGETSKSFKYLFEKSMMFATPRGQEWLLLGPPTGQEAPKTGQEAPNTGQEAPKTAQEAPKKPPKRAPRSYIC